MSLEERTILDKTVNDLTKEAWDVMILTYDLWIAVIHSKEQPDPELLRELKNRVKNLKALCDELPL